MGALGSSCSCDPPIEDPPAVQPVGSVRVDVDGAGATLVLVGLEQPLRAFEVDVSVQGGRASALVAIADHDVVEAGLRPEDGGPKDRFTVVVGDTRRVPIVNGALAVLSLDGGATVVLSGAAGIDQSGKKRSLTVVAQ
ncbi:MAG: hypothetical protein Q8O67_30725 [Deltaproteobacteria bacterium]|nr:hypothetical protein [Deltaproteobacteria bacterium]